MGPTGPMYSEEEKREAAEWVVFEDPAMAEGFTQFPNRVLRDPTLSSGARVFYGIVLSYAWQSQFCFPGQKTLKAELGVKSEDTYYRILNEVKDRGLIDVKRRKGALSNLYIIKRLGG